MDFKNLLGTNAEEVNKRLADFLPENIDKAWLDKNVGRGEYDIKAVNEFLTKPIWDFLRRGGKRWRPLLMFLSCEAVGGNAKQISDFAVVPELIHNGTLIVDDVEDSSLIRRGKPSLHISYGVDLAVNAGNMLYYLPLLIVKNSKISDDKKIKVYELINNEMLKLHFGQGTDIYWHKIKNESVSEQQYFSMCANKTGTLARLAAKLGGIVGGAGDEQVNALGNFAETIGVAFQIQDDVLNLKGGLGKDVGEDITEGKMSLPIIKTLAAANETDKSRILQLLRKHSNDKNEIDEVINLINRYGSLSYSVAAAKNIVEKSWQELDALLKPSEAKNKLQQLADFMVDREF